MKTYITMIVIVTHCLTVSSQIKVACVGNSITAGYGLSWDTPNYPARLQSLLGTGYTVENDGVSSTTLLKKGNNPYWVNGRLPQVFSFKPDIVVVKLGTNDTKPENWTTHSSEFKTDYQALVDTLANMPSKPKVFVVLPVPVFNNPTSISWGIRDSIIKLEMPLIREVATARGLTVIDCYNPLLKFPQFFSVDGVHPDGVGADTIAHIVYRAIKTTTVDKPISTTGNHIQTVKYGTGSITFSVPFDGFLSISIVDISGKLVKQVQDVCQSTLTLNTSDISKGVYLVTVRSMIDNKVYSQKINLLDK